MRYNQEDPSFVKKVLKSFIDDHFWNGEFDFFKKSELFGKPKPGYLEGNFNLSQMANQKYTAARLHKQSVGEKDLENEVSKKN